MKKFLRKFSVQGRGQKVLQALSVGQCVECCRTLVQVGPDHWRCSVCGWEAETVSSLSDFHAVDRITL